MIIESTPSRQQMIETIFFILRSLSRAQKKNPAIGIMKKIGIKSEYLKTASFEPLSPHTDIISNTE